MENNINPELSDDELENVSGGIAVYSLPRTQLDPDQMPVDSDTKLMVHYLPSATSGL